VKNRAMGGGIFLLPILLLLLTSGCGSKVLPLLHRASQAGSLPEQIHQWPLHKSYEKARVAVFTFSEPAHHTDVGYNAANSLYLALVQHNIFQEVIPEFNTQGLDLAAQLETARNMGYDLIITGSVVSYLDGTLYEESRVDVAVAVYDVARAEDVWHAVATATSRPQAGKDYYLFKTKGEMPLPPAALIEMNTKKFLNMFESTLASR
jgi:hypothetical protein